MGLNIGQVLKAIAGVVKGSSKGVLLQVCRTADISQAVLQAASTYKTSADIRRAIAGLADKHLGKRGANSLHSLAESMAAKAVTEQVRDPARKFPAFKQLIQEQAAADAALDEILSKLPLPRR